MTVVISFRIVGRLLKISYPPTRAGVLYKSHTSQEIVSISRLTLRHVYPPILSAEEVRERACEDTARRATLEVDTANASRLALVQLESNAD